MPKLKPTGSKLIPEKLTTTSPTKVAAANLSKPAYGVRQPKSAAFPQPPKQSTTATRNSLETRSITTPANQRQFNQFSSTVNNRRTAFNQRVTEVANTDHSSSSSPEISSTKKKLESLFRNNENSSPPRGTGTSLAVEKPVPPQKYHSLRKFPNNHQSSLSESNTSTMPAHKGQAPQPPGQKPVLQRTNSQSNSSGNTRPGAAQRPSPRPPNAKPPPPPKTSTIESNRTTTVGVAKNRPTKTQASNQSVGAKSSLHGSMLKHSVVVPQQPVKPPAPPRGSSVPSSTTTTTTSQSRPTAASVATTSQNSSHKVVRPPSGPPPPPPNRVSSVSTSNSSHRLHSELSVSSKPNIVHHKPVAPSVPHHVNLAPAPPVPVDYLPAPPPPPHRFDSLTRGKQSHVCSIVTNHFFCWVPQTVFVQIATIPITATVTEIFRLGSNFVTFVSCPRRLHFKASRRCFQVKVSQDHHHHLLTLIDCLHTARKARRREPPPPPPPSAQPLNGGAFTDKMLHIQITRKV